MSGAILSLAGASFQAIFHNPLASPYTLGVSSGSALGAALYISAGWEISWLILPGSTACALFAAICTLLLLYALIRKASHYSPTTLLLGGVVISFFCASTILFVQFIADASKVFEISRWMMGSLANLTLKDSALLLPFFILAIVSSWKSAAELDLITVGEDFALGKGVDVERVIFEQLIMLSLATAGVVSVCGPIGFVGIIVPHICRALVGHSHKTLLYSVAVFGGIFLVASDAIARLLILPFEIPAGVITSMIGGPFFLYVLFFSSTHGEVTKALDT